MSAAAKAQNRGHFLPGNPGGPGNPHAAAMSLFRSQLLDAVTPADLKAIIKAQVAKAKKGDLRAAQLILSYTAGAPMAAAPDPDIESGDITFVSTISVDGVISCREERAPSPNGG